MSIITRIKQFISPTGEQAVNDLPSIVGDIWSKHSFTPVTNWNAAYTMWKANPIAQGCTLAYSLMMPEAQLGVITPNGYDYEQPVVELLTRDQWRVSMAEIMTILCIGGNAYGYKLRNSQGAVIGLRWYSDKRFAPVNNGWGDVDFYFYYDGMQSYRVPKEDVVHLVGFWYDPEKPLGGGSPVDLASQSIEGFNEASSTVYNIHKNDAMPKTVVVYDEELTPDQIAAAERTFKRKYGGERRGAVGHMWGVKDIKRLALDWAEMGLSDTFGQYETRICGVYRVHPIIAFTHAGLATSTYSNFEQASKDFTTMSRVPFWNMLAEQLNAQLAIPDFGVQLGFDLSTVQALAGQAIASEAISIQDDDISDDSPDNGDVQTLSLEGGAASKAAPFPRLLPPAVKAYEEIDFTPPQGVRDEAKKGLDWRAEYGRGGTAVGVARARDLSNGRTISPDTARRMNSYFARHEVDKQGEGWRPGEDGFPSAGRIAWALWGGDPGQVWSAKLVAQMNAEDEREGRSVKVQNADRAVIVDIDGTLVTDTGNPKQNVIDHINGKHNSYVVHIVTGRTDDRRAETERLLESIGVLYDELHLNDTTAPTIRWKEYKAGLILEETPVSEAIDNDADVREMYRRLGIRAISPSDIPQSRAELMTNVKTWLQSPDPEVRIKALDTVLADVERKLARAWSKELTKLQQAVVGAKTLVKAEDFNEDIWRQRFVDATEVERSELVTLILTLAAAEVDYDGEPGEFGKARDEGIRESAGKISDSVGTIKSELTEILVQNQGLPNKELTALLESYFDNLKAPLRPGMKQSRADVIARTTGTATTGVVQKDVWKAIGGITREWTALSGARDAHAAASGSREDNAGLFTVGGEQTPYPAGPGLSAANSVNCRCFARAVRVT